MTINVSTYIVLIVGVVFSLLFTEIVGISPSGLVVPGYLVLIVNKPKAIILSLFIALLTFFIVKFIIGKVTILYGKRKFTAMVAISVVFAFLFRILLPGDYATDIGLTTIGIIVPGLMANTIERQGFLTTILSTSFLVAMTFGTTLLIQRVM